MIAVCRRCRAVVRWPAGSRSLRAPAPAGARLADWRCPDDGGRLSAYRPGRALGDGVRLVATGAVAPDFARVVNAAPRQPRLPGVDQQQLRGVRA